MSTQQRNLLARIDGDSSGFTRAVKSAEQSAKVFERELKKIETRQTQSVAHVTQMRARYEAQAARQEAQSSRAMEQRLRAREQAMTRAGQIGVAAGAAVAAGLALSTRAALQWESAWAGVTKTVDGNAKQMAVLEGELRDLTAVLPASHREIAAVAEAAGQLGIQRENIAAFTKVMIDLGETTNLTADVAATSMAQIANVMGTAPQDIERMGAALVALGNNGASTEADIVQMAQRIAGAGKQVGLAEADVFAIANALASVGIEAEAGGSAISRVLSNLSVMVETGSADLQGFADVAGVSVGEFSTLFRDDAAKAVGAFTDGLGRIQESGGSAIVTLEELGITEIRQRDTLLRLAGAQGLLTASVDLGREAWAANTALVDEADKRYATTEAKMQIARNAVNDLAIDVGSALLPALASMAGGLSDVAGWLGGLPAPLKGVAAAVGVLAASVGILGGGALIAIPKIAAFKAAIIAMGWEGEVAEKRMRRLGNTMKGGLIVAGAAAAATAIFSLIDAFAAAAPETTDLGKALLTLGQDGQVTGDLLRVVGSDFENLGAKVRTANSSKWFSFTEGRLEVQEARDELKSLDEAMTTLVQNGQGDLAADIYGRMTRAVEEQGGKVSELEESLAGYGNAQREAGLSTDLGTVAAQAMADAVGGIDDSVTNAYSSLGAFTAAMGYSEDQTKELTKQIEEWAKSYAGFVEPLDAYTSLLSDKEAAEQKSAQATADATESQEDSWEDYADAVSVSVKEYLGELEKQVQAQQDWSTNMLLLSSRVSEGTLDKLARMGPEGAPLVAELVNASDAELAKLETLFAARTEGATGAMAAELRLAQPVLAGVAKVAGQKTADALARELDAGKTTVAAIAAEYGISISGAIVPPVNRANAEVRSLTRGLEGLDGRNVSFTVRTNYVSSGVPRQVGVGGGLTQSRGSVLDFFARGGLREQHVAQIAPAGAWRVWAEPETGGEAYIPLAVNKRARSIEIWKETGRRLDLYANGAVNGGRVSPTDPRPLTAVVSGMTDVASIQAMVRAWEAYNDQLEQAARRQALFDDLAQASANMKVATTTEQKTRTQREFNDARKALADFDYAAARDREAAAVERQIAQLRDLAQVEEAAARANQEANDLRRQQQSNRYDLGRMGADRYADILKRRMDDEIRFSDAWTALYREREQVMADQADVAKKLTDDLADTLSQRASAEESAYARLNRLLDEEVDLRARMASGQREHDEAVLEVQGRQVQAEADYYAQRSALGRSFTDEQARILADRRDALANATALDQAIDFRRGLPADWLVANVRRQVEALAEWMEELDLARRMGVSEAVIEGLGLDEGPETLAQVRALTRASADEIDQLNRAVEDRTRISGEQVRREQVGNYGQLGEQLTAAQARFASELLALEQQYLAEQASLSAQLQQMQAEFVVEQTALAEQLAKIGQDQGRSYSDALAAGIASGIPGIRAAAEEALAATKALADAKAALARAEQAPAPAADVNGPALPGPFKRIGVRRATYDSGGWLQPGYTLAYNGTGQPERVTTAAQDSGRTINVMPGAQVTVRESVDVDLLVRRAEFLVATGSM